MKKTLTLNARTRTMGTPQTTVENVRVALCVHKHPSSVWIAVLSQCWGHSEGYCKRDVFIWLHKLPVCLVSDSSRASGLQSYRGIDRSNSHLFTPASAALQKHQPVAIIGFLRRHQKFVFYVQHFDFSRLCQLMKYLNQNH